MQYMNEKIGSWQVSGGAKGGKVQFRIFFPKDGNGLQHLIRNIRICGDFQKQLGQSNWDKSTAGVMIRSEHEEGEIWSWTTPADLKAGFYEYKYVVSYTDPMVPDRWISDPCTRYGGADNMNAAVVVGGSQPSDNVIAPLAGGRRPLRDLVIYEMMIDDFTDEYRGLRAPLDAVRDKLDFLASTGFNAILFMPWTGWNDRRFNWGYTPSLYYSVAYRYAHDLNKPAEKLSWLKKLISECHERGIHVIMDGVFNHVFTGFPYKTFYQHYDRDCPYTGRFYGEFDGLQDLDFNNACTRELIFDVCRYWIDTFRIDGIRFDNTINFYRKGDDHGLPMLMIEIDDYIKSIDEYNFSMTLEHLSIDAIDVTLNTRADSYWDNALYSECFESLWNDQITPALLNALNNNRYLLDSGKVPTIYLGNHDHAHVTWQAGARDNAGALAWYRTQPYVIAMLTSPGAPMVQNGQEFAEDHWMPENDYGSGRRVQPRPLHWSYADDSIGGSMLSLYRRLLRLRKQYEVLRADSFEPDYWEEWQTRFNPDGVGIDTKRQLLVYRRECRLEDGKLQRAVIVLNFSSDTHWLELAFPEDGEWIELLGEPQWVAHVRNGRFGLNVPSHWGHIFYRT